MYEPSFAVWLIMERPSFAVATSKLRTIAIFTNLFFTIMSICLGAAKLSAIATSTV